MNYETTEMTSECGIAEIAAQEFRAESIAVSGAA